MHFMSKKAQSHELTYDLIKRVVRGEPSAVEEILRIYEPYHNSLVSKEYVGEDGKIYKVVDEDKKIMLQHHVIDALQKKWRKLI